MKIVLKYKILIVNILFLHPLSYLPISAQVTNQATLARISEEEIKLQEKYMEATVQQNLGKLEGAAKLFEDVLEKNPKCDGCAFQLTRIHTALKDYQKAIDFAKKAVALDPKNKWYKMSLAESFEKIGKDKDAAEVYKTLAEGNFFDEDYTQEVYFRWAYCHVRMADPMKAIKILDDLEKKAGVKEEVTDKKHAIYEAAGDTKKAAAELKKLADAHPQVIEYQHLAADYFLKIGDKNTAQELHNRILKLDPNDSKAKMASVAAQKPTAGGDIAFLNSLKDLFKKPDIKIDEKIKTILPHVNKIAERKDPALATAGLELAQILEQAHPTEAKAYALQGDMLYHNGKSQEALDKYKKCTQINKAVYSVWEQMLYIYEETGQYNELLKTSEQAIDLFPNQAVAFIFNGIANEKKGNYTEAISALDQAVMMTAKKPNLKHDALVELGVTYSKSKNYEKSDKAFDEALKLNNKSSIALIKYANALQLRGVSDRAKPMADEALSLSMESDPVILEFYGDYIFKTGDKDKALQYWQKAKQRGNKSPVLEKKILEKSFVE
jgi:tetratricopeptide (TPR) repeat protein